MLRCSIDKPSDQFVVNGKDLSKNGAFLGDLPLTDFAKAFLLRPFGEAIHRNVNYEIE